MSTWSRRRSLILLSTTVLLMTIMYLTREPILLGLGNFLIVQDNLHPADLIHPLGGGLDRLDYAVELYKQGYAPKIHFSLWDDYMPLLQRSKSEIISEYALAQGFPEDAIDFAPAESTHHEALITRGIIEAENLDSVLVVSSPYHMRRIKMIFDHVIGDRAKLIYVAVPDEWSDFRREWWRDEESAVALLHEYIAIPYYYFKYIFLK